MLCSVSGEIEPAFDNLEQGEFFKLLKSLEGADNIDLQICIEAVYGQTQQIVQTHAAQNTDQNGTMDIFMAHNSDCKESTDGYYHRHDISPVLCQQIEGSQINTRGRTGYNNAGILQP